MILKIWNKLNIDISCVILFIIAFIGNFFEELIFIYLVIALHELGHIFFVKLFGGYIEKITVSMLGIIASIKENINVNKLQKLLINMGRNYYKSVNFNVF